MTNRNYHEMDHFELIEELERRDEQARKQHFQDMAKMQADNLHFADAYELDAMDRVPDHVTYMRGLI